ncbi:MAG: trypsin-like peptidase domain-containing protein [Akkermansiaceae bacterium]|nr:trypsin-like peptidase domain-containing protein [Akkermansiaceae bacterium]
MKYLPNHLPALLGFSLIAQGLAVSVGHAAPETVDDAVIIKSLSEGIGALVDGGKASPSKKLTPQLERRKCTVKVDRASSKALDNLYGQCADSVIAIASVYKCGKCDNWHNSGAATGWILSEDGVMVTNYHVFDGKEVAGFGIRTRDGKVAPVTEILAASKRDDVVIFKVAGSGFKPLPLGPDANVGSDLHIIAHPDSRFYTYTAGKVSRYYRKRVPKGDGPSIMAVTAEFARGSSGGPVMDSAGNVVGMVASTQSIYYPPKKKTDTQGPFQMVIRNCVPVSAIRALIER